MKYKNKGIFKNKIYAHFDTRKKVENIKDYIYNKGKIKQHSFYPFVLDIHKIKRFNKEKYLLLKKDNGDKKEKVKIYKEKKRNIMFSSHIDRYIYQLYNNRLNEKYNKYVKDKGINKCSVAYRNNLGDSNINIAHDIFKFIIDSEECHIIVGDFKDFFEQLNHKYLKKMLLKILDKNNLDEDYYAIFKNITKYSYFDLKDLCEIANIKKKDIFKFDVVLNENTNKKEYIFELEQIISLQEMKQNKRKYIRTNTKDEGIPQGSAISSVLANIYMIDADKKINDFVTSNEGLYRRYSDDFIVIIPNKDEKQFEKIIDSIKSILVNNGNPELKDEKTGIYYYNKNKIYNLNETFLDNIKNGKNELDYLGFTFNGNQIRIRDKTMSKYYYRMYRKIKTIALCHGISKNGKKISFEDAYKLYSIKGKNSDKGNFITYNERCENVFKDLGCFVSYKKRFMSKLKCRFNKENKKYKKVSTKSYYGILKMKKSK